MRSIGRALATIARRFPQLKIVFPIHRNPLVRDAVLPWISGLPNVVVTEPLPYGGFARLMNRATIILSDSGGVQEEGPSLGKPVVVMRDTTERPEAVLAGTVRLVGTDEDVIVRAVQTLLTDPTVYADMAMAVNPYGDGAAARRTVAAIEHLFDLGPAPDEFRPELPQLTLPSAEVESLRSTDAPTTTVRSN
jgi:UDP-N-acetylglucosamine 2-epimerase (non-hydrolysing)